MSPAVVVYLTKRSYTSRLCISRSRVLLEGLQSEGKHDLSFTVITPFSLNIKAESCSLSRGRTSTSAACDSSGHIPCTSHDSKKCAFTIDGDLELVQGPT
jgi:hypothetical protein